MKDSQSLRAYARLVAEMRRRQREADRTDSIGDRVAAQPYEKRVDDATREVLERPMLFGREDG